jgi:iron(III) transport system substrate-binding protein
MAVIPLLGIVAACSSGQSGTSGSASAIDKAYTFAKSEMPGVSKSLIQGAAKEGTVSFYTSSSTATDALATAFEKDFPFIKVQQLQLAGTQVDTRFESEKSAGKNVSDVYLTSNEATARSYASKGYCATYTPTSDAQYPASAKVANQVYDWQGNVQGIAYMKGTLSDAQVKSLGSWSSLMSSSLQGKVFGWQPPNLGGSALYVNTYLYKTYGESLWQKNESMAKKVDFFTSSNPMVTDLVSGEIDVTGPVSLFAAYTAFQSGAPIQWVIPTPTVAVPEAGCISSHEPHPDAAELLWDFILGNPGQDVLAGYGTVSYKTDFTPPAEPQFNGDSWYKAPSKADLVSLPLATQTNLGPKVESDFNSIYKTHG